MKKINKKIKVKLYYREQYIKTIRIKQEENILRKIIPITVFFKKHLFMTNVAGIVVAPFAIKYTENNIIYAEVNLWEGARENE